MFKIVRGRCFISGSINDKQSHRNIINSRRIGIRIMLKNKI